MGAGGRRGAGGRGSGVGALGPSRLVAPGCCDGVLPPRGARWLRRGWRTSTTVHLFPGDAAGDEYMGGLCLAGRKQGRGGWLASGEGQDTAAPPWVAACPLRGGSCGGDAYHGHCLPRLRRPVGRPTARCGHVPAAAGKKNVGARAYGGGQRAAYVDGRGSGPRPRVPAPALCQGGRQRGGRGPGEGRGWALGAHRSSGQHGRPHRSGTPMAVCTVDPCTRTAQRAHAA